MKKWAVGFVVALGLLSVGGRLAYRGALPWLGRWAQARPLADDGDDRSEVAYVPSALDLFVDDPTGTPLAPLASEPDLPTVDVHFYVLTSNSDAVAAATPGQLRLEVDILNRYFRTDRGKKL